MTMTRSGCAALLLTLGACGGGPDGVYLPKDNQGFWDKMDFQSDRAVQITAMGQTKMGEYVSMDDGRIRVMISGDVLTLREADDGCLVVSAGDAAESEAVAQLGWDLAELGRYCPD